MNYELIENDIRVKLHDNNKDGWNGDYDPSDPEDEVLLRFNIYITNHNGAWEEVQESSFATRLPATLKEELAQVALKKIMQSISEPIKNKDWLKCRRAADAMSWISPDVVKEAAGK